VRGRRGDAAGGLAHRGDHLREDRRRPAGAGARRVPGGSLMFTGIVEEVGSVAQVHKLDSGALGLTVSASIPFVNALHVGDSVSVSGCCLTVVERATVSGGTFRVELIEETLSRTAPKWTPGSDVNLEQAMRAGGALGGHVVTGHVDGVAEVVAVDITPGASVIRFRAPAALAAQLVPKGSVTVDGV